MRLFAWSCLVILLFLAVGCGERKKMILSERKMEDVLFDYHLAEGISRHQNADSATQAHYFDLVLKKHNVTREEFDSSMVYYMTHADRMYAIYDKLSDRLTNEGRLQGVDAGNLVLSGGLDGDTANIWQLADKHVFSTYVPDNILRYRIEADSTFRPGDNLILSFSSDYLFQDGIRNGFAMFSVRLRNDSVITRTKQISAGNTNRLEVNDTKRIGIKEILGYFTLHPSNGRSEKPSASVRLMVLSDIRIVKMHTEVPPDFGKEEEKAKADSVAAPADTTTVKPETNEKENKENEKIKPVPTAFNNKNSRNTSLH
ncbi:MAG: DUF4296 domain-containing protein [Prevotella sp.]|nr:DUF4296 domain-containing protein [Prevotella sp.]